MASLDTLSVTAEASSVAAGACLATWGHEIVVNVVGWLLGRTGRRQGAGGSLPRSAHRRGSGPLGSAAFGSHARPGDRRESATTIVPEQSVGRQASGLERGSRQIWELLDDIA